MKGKNYAASDADPETVSASPTLETWKDREVFRLQNGEPMALTEDRNIQVSNSRVEPITSTSSSLRCDAAKRLRITEYWTW